MDDLESYAPGDVLPDGRIKLEKRSALFGWAAPYGIVWVKPDQAVAAEKHGWKTNGSGDLVTIERAAPAPGYSPYQNGRFVP